MKVALLSESDVDEAIVRIFVEAKLQQPVEVVSRRRRPGGWAPVLAILPTVVKELHYHTDAQGLVVVIDSDATAPHSPTHGESQESVTDCRLCEIRKTLNAVMQGLRPRSHLGPLKTALGLAVPSIEAWLLFGRVPGCSEAGYIQFARPSTAPRKSTPELILQYKKLLYGSERAPRLQRASAAAIAVAEKLENLTASFPGGFGSLMRDLERW